MTLSEAKTRVQDRLRDDPRVVGVGVGKVGDRLGIVVYGTMEALDFSRVGDIHVGLRRASVPVPQQAVPVARPASPIAGMGGVALALGLVGGLAGIGAAASLARSVGHPRAGSRSLPEPEFPFGNTGEVLLAHGIAHDGQHLALWGQPGISPLPGGKKMQKSPLWAITRANGRYADNAMDRATWETVVRAPRSGFGREYSSLHVYKVKTNAVAVWNHLVPGAVPGPRGSGARGSGAQGFTGRGSRSLEIALEDLPEWWIEEPVYHGTNTESWRSIQREGLRCPVAESASGDECGFGWKDVWREEVYASWKALSLEQHQRFAALLGVNAKDVTRRFLGENTSLFWVSKRKSVTENYDVPTVVDLSQLRFYWWFKDDVLGNDSYVFVLPIDNQAPSSILAKLPYEPKSSRFGYRGLKALRADSAARRAYDAGVPLDVTHAWMDAGTSDEAEPFDETREIMFYTDPASATSYGRGGVVRFPLPRQSRLIGARHSVYATRQALPPPSTWEINSGRYYDGDLENEALWIPFSQYTTERA